MGVCGVILCGGQSRRMGTDKAWLKVENSNLLHRQYQLLKGLKLHSILLSGKPVRHFGIMDSFPGKGPLAGIHAAMTHSRQSHLLIIPVDMPLLQKNDLQRLINSGHEEMPVHYEQGCLPLLLPNDSDIRGWIETQLHCAANRDLSLRALCRHFKATTLPHFDPIQLSNANTPQQWQQCLALM